MRAKLNHSKAGKEGTANLLFYCVGTEDIYLGGEDRFNGSVIALNAKIIGGQEQNKVFEGMFIGKEVNFHQGSTVTCVPYIELVPEIWTYKYDWNDKLIEVRHNYQTVMTSEYGIDGERIRKNENGIDTYYLFPEYEEDWKGDTIADCAMYNFANGKRIAKEIMAGELLFYVGDHLGSNTVILDDSKNVVKTMKYLPYGGTAYESGTHDEDYKFNGKELDATGLYNYGARFYDPDLGRFITADTVTPGGGFDPQGLNRYSYCRNNPVKYVDPTGHTWEYKSSSGGRLYTISGGVSYTFGNYAPADAWYSGLEANLSVGGKKLGELLAKYQLQNISGGELFTTKDQDFQLKYTYSIETKASPKDNMLGISAAAIYGGNWVDTKSDDYGNLSAQAHTLGLEGGLSLIHQVKSGQPGPMENKTTYDLAVQALGDVTYSLTNKAISGGPELAVYVTASSTHKSIESIGAKTGIGLDWLSSGLRLDLNFASRIKFKNGLAMKAGFDHFIHRVSELGAPSIFPYGQVDFNASYTPKWFNHSIGGTVGGAFNIYGTEPGTQGSSWGLKAGAFYQIK
jgi:RHS repeat-associated protein